MKTFKSFDDVVKEIGVINKAHYNGRPFGIWGRGDYGPYDIDSALLEKEVDGKRQLTEYFIRCIDGDTGEIVELDDWQENEDEIFCDWEE